MIRLNETTCARRISEGTAPATGWRTETWVIHPEGSPGEAIGQVQLFFDHGHWHAWPGNLVRAEACNRARSLAELRNTSAEGLLALAVPLIQSESIRAWATSDRNKATWLRIASGTIAKGNVDPPAFAAYMVCVAIGA